MKILKCMECRKYTLKKICPECGAKTVEPKPAKFSLSHDYGKYRILLKKEKLKC